MYRFALLGILIAGCPLYGSSFIDAREIGVDCSGTRDSSAVLNALGSLTGVELIFPANENGHPCVVNLANTWTLKNSAAFTLNGLARAGDTGFGPRFKWMGAIGGTMLDLRYVQGFEIRNLGFDANARASVAINVDKSGPGGTMNTTDGKLVNVHIDADLSERKGSDNFIGLQISQRSRENVEDMQLLDSTVDCRAAKNSVGVSIGDSFNAKNESIRRNNIRNCTYGVNMRNGTGVIAENEFAGNARVDVFLSHTIAEGAMRVVGNLSESGGNSQFLVAIWNGAKQTIEFSRNNIPINTGCAADVTSYKIESSVVNTWFKNGRAGGTKACATRDGRFLWSGPSGLEYADITGSLLKGLFLNGGYFNEPIIGVTAYAKSELQPGQPVKWDPSSEALISSTNTADTGAGIAIGVVINNPGKGTLAAVATSGYTAMQLDHGGQCRTGEFVVVSPLEDGKVSCTATYPGAGKVVGVAMTHARASGSVLVMIGLR